MSSRAGSTFVTFLMSIPVAAAGLMALFGVPPLASVIAASRGQSDTSHGFEEVGRGGSHASDSQFEDWSPDSAPGWSGEGTNSSKPDEKSPKPGGEVDDLGFPKFPGERSKEENSKEPRKGSPRTRRDQFASLGNTAKADSARLLDSDLPKPRDLDFESGDDKSARPLSMKESLKNLNSLGVKHYHLERGADQDTWLFVCLFSPGDDTRLTHRFEAESDEPEGAVAETVKQIDSWLLKRFRDKQPISQNAL